MKSQLVISSCKACGVIFEGVSCLGFCLCRFPGRLGFTRHGLGVAGDGAVDFDAVAVGEHGVEFAELGVDADLLRFQIDLGELFQDA